MAIITTDKLSKRYGATAVLRGIDLDVRPQRLVGFLGPNGAGKTTTIRILLGLLRASSGSARIGALDCFRDGQKIRHDVGYLPGDVYLYSNMTGRGMLDFMQRARGVDCRPEVARLSQVFDLELDRRIRKYSTGMRQKLGLIQALMHRPRLLILDEPTSALDPLIRTVVFEELRSAVQRGQSVLFSSHSLDEVEQLCDEVIILRDGVIVEQQSIEVLKQRALRRVQIVFESELEIPRQFPAEMKNVVVNATTIAGTWNAEVGRLITWLAPFQIQDLIIERPDLNDLFMTYYARNKSPSTSGQDRSGHRGAIVG